MVLANQTRTRHYIVMSISQLGALPTYRLRSREPSVYSTNVVAWVESATRRRCPPMAAMEAAVDSTWLTPHRLGQLGLGHARCLRIWARR